MIATSHHACPDAHAADQTKPVWHTPVIEAISLAQTLALTGSGADSAAHTGTS